jgi:transposase
LWKLLHRVQEVIPMNKSRAYAAVRVNQLDGSKLAGARPGQDVVIGTDIGKFQILAMCRWADGQWERPWRMSNPSQIGDFVALVQELGAGRRVLVAMEPSGTYGDALRQALADAEIEVRQVSPKAACDYAEIFDGVPSQHDGKDAAVVAELAAHGKAREWPYQPGDAWEQELKYWVEWMDAQRRILQLWTGRIEGLLARHWPEATRVLRGSSATLLRVLCQYGGPAELAADPQAAQRVTRWGGRYLSPAKVEALVTSARTSMGVRQQEWSRRQLREYAGQALQARQEVKRSQRQLRRLASGHEVLQAQGRVVGVPTACVLWTSVGDPRDYFSAKAYRKALGLNLVERSSGTYQGKLRISKRGHARPRQWLYFAALRLVQEAGVQRWYEAKKSKDGNEAKRALVAVMRRLVLALHGVAVDGRTFAASRLFPGRQHDRPRAKVEKSPARKRRRERRTSERRTSERVSDLPRR